MKICCTCKQEKEYSEFYKNISRNDGYQDQCTECKKKYVYIKPRYEVNVIEKKCRICEDIKHYTKFSKHANHKDGLKNICKSCTKDYNENNKEYINKRNLEYWHKKGKQQQKVIRKRRRKEDPIFKLKCLIRSRTREAFKAKGFKKNTKSEEMLGCEWIVAKNHIENLFVEEMSWGNHGEWHIDHIIPLCAAKNEEQLIDLAFYLNLQPLWKKENLSKGGKY